MGLPDADTLVIAGSSKSQEIEALKAIYGTGATVRVATSGDDIIGILTSYSTIKRLVIGTHGSQGDVIIRGTHIPIGRLAASLRSARVRPRVTDVVIFDGCNVAGESESLVSFLEALLAPRLQAFAESHLWWSDEYMFGKGADANAMEPLRRQYESNRDYLVAGQPTWPAMVKRGGRIRIWYEGFSRTLRERPRNDTERRMVVPRSKLETVRSRKKDVGNLGSQTDRPGGPMLQVEISDQ